MCVNQLGEFKDDFLLLVVDSLHPLVTEYTRFIFRENVIYMTKSTPG